MKDICVFDTSIASTNIGDQIIMESFYKEMKDIIDDGYCIKIATHQPLCHNYQDIKRNPLIRHLHNCDYKFIGGSNIVLKNMFLPLTQWNINLFNCSGYKNSVLVGCGLFPNSKRLNLYTKIFYKKVLSKKYIHSVRDEAAKAFLEKMGFKAINTGCPTIWSINDELCKSIPTKKNKDVIFTLTDYAKDYKYDADFVKILKSNYEKIYFFPQGIEDLEYLQEISSIDDIVILPSDLKAFDEFLDNNSIDYVGTRLHAGIFAIKHKIRSIIIAIDNRTRDMKKSYNLNCIERNDIKLLEQVLNAPIVTNIKIDKEKIEEFKKQFK